MLSSLAKDLSEMLETRFRKVEIALLGCGTAKSCAERLRSLREGLTEGLGEGKYEIIESIRDEEATLNAFMQEGLYKMGFLDGLEATFLALDKAKMLEALDCSYLEQVDWHGMPGRHPTP
jgi:hypothetical protein